MRSIVLSGFRLIARAVRLARHYVIAQVVGNNSSGPGDDTEPSRCLTDSTIQVTANPSKVTYGQPSVVSWSVGLPNGCGAVHVRLNGEAVARSGSRTVSPPRSMTFFVTASETRSGRYAETTRSTLLEVDYPDRVIIDASTSDPIQVLVGALEAPNRIVGGKPIPIIVELCDVDLDLTGCSLVVGSDRSLIASPDCARGPRSFGPRIFVTDTRGLSKPLFVIRGDNILFSGFRLEGPTSGIGSGGDRLERAIKVFPFEAREPIRNIEISNMEIFHWSGAAIDIRDNTVLMERGRLFNTNEGAVRVKNNYIHHNRHDSGNGYGVEVASGAYALIEQNVFDENRHAIAGGSSDGKVDYSGYTARDNLILSEGGLHCSDRWYWALTGWTNSWPRCWRTHQIDMHGTKSTIFLGEKCCGTAGETIIIERNTILYTKGWAIKIRGNPADKAVVDGNVFKHKSGDAIDQNGEPGFGDNISNPIDVRPNNVFGANPLDELASCDFVGDGKQDLFMATGVTWWAKSLYTCQWRYLNTMAERLPQLELVDIDNDGKCDVALRPPNPTVPPRKYSKNGTGPWVPVLIEQ